MRHFSPLAKGPLALALCAIGLSACATSPDPAYQPAPAVEVAPDQALASYRAELQASESISGRQSTDEENRAVQRHVMAMLGDDAVKEFELFIYINRAAEGPMAQRAFLFDRQDDGSIRHLETWLVSTGREQRETSPKGASKFTTTPTGVFQFDINHFVRLHKSNAWESGMPWAMFLQTRDGGPTDGIALHAALDKYVHNLGQRSSAGCIRLLPSNAERLYKLLLTRYAGTVPKTKTVGETGVAIGTQRVQGTKALVIVDDVYGPELIARYAAGSLS